MASKPLVSNLCVFDNLYATFKTKLVHVATDLRIFDALSGERTLTSEQIAEQLNFNASRLQRLLLSLVSLGLLERHGDAFRNTPESELYLVSTSPRSVLGLIVFMESMSHNIVDGLKKCITDKDAADGGNHQIFEKVLETHPQFLKSFTEAMEGMAHADMDCLGLADFTGVRDVVDLGGCLGWHARAIRRLHPHVEHITVADLEPVVKMGSELPENKETIGIDFVKVNFITDETLPSADAYVLGHILHGFGDTDVTQLLKKVHTALREGGRLILMEPVLNEDRTSPQLAVLLDVLKMNHSPGRDRTSDEYRQLLETAQFTDYRCLHVDGSGLFDVITVKKN